MTDALSDLRVDFPAYLIGTEAMHNGQRYVAVRRGPGPGPHTVVTPDLAELRSALSPAARPESSHDDEPTQLS
jgi:hypothetical protein